MPTSQGGEKGIGPIAWLGSDLQSESRWWVEDFDEWNGIVIHFDWKYFYCWCPNQSFSPVILENHLVSFYVRGFETVEARLDPSFPFEKPSQWLIHFHEMNRTYASVQGDQSRHGLQTLNRRRVKSDHGANIVKAKIVSNLIVAECLDVFLK